jgi:hypothetical protein
LHFRRPWFLVLTCLALLSGCDQRNKSDVSRFAAAPAAPRETASIPVAANPSVRPEARSLAAGTKIGISISEVLDSESVYFQPFLSSTVADDVRNEKGVLAIPANSHALLVIRGNEKIGTVSKMVLGLNRIDASGNTFKSADGTKDLATIVLQEDSSKGLGHRSVHLEKNSVLPFKLDSDVQVR